MIPIAYCAAAGFAVSFTLIALMLHHRWDWAIDHPNERSLHLDPTPRSGGLAVIAGIVAASAIAGIWHEKTPVAAVALAAMLAGVSLADDRAGLPITIRLGTHLLAAGVFAAHVTDSVAPWWWMLAAVIAITAITNFYNFMDGANGLAGGMAISGFVSYGLAALPSAPGMATVCFSVAAAAAGFLCFNLRGRIFMGDGGSVPLGFLAATIGLEGWVRGIWPVWFPLLVFAPFLVDAVVTLLRRMARGERFWLAHREHYYQRLVRSGWSHLRLVSLEYPMMLACAAGALIARIGDQHTRTAIFTATALLLLVTGFAIDYKWRRHLACQAGAK